MVWRLGVVPYLNADPLAAALGEPDTALLVGDAVQVRALVPAELLPLLLTGELDAALVSTGGALPHPELLLLPGMGICSRGTVRSITLYTHRHPSAVRRVALDASSRSAVLLARILLAEYWGATPEYLPRPPHLPAMLADADAALLIGNPALLANQALDEQRWRGPLPTRYDLGAAWNDLTGLPFVYAAWFARRGADHARLARLLMRARHWGVRRVPQLAARGAAALGLPAAVTRHYLAECIHYDLGAPELAGMERFLALGKRHGLFPPDAAVRLAPLPTSAHGE